MLGIISMKIEVHRCNVTTLQGSGREGERGRGGEEEGKKGEGQGKRERRGGEGGETGQN